MKKNYAYLAFATAGIIFSTVLKSQNACFLPQTTFATAAASVGTTTGDFNADGFQDIATANQTGTVSVLLGTGTGSFAATSNFAAGTQPYGITTGDFNEDTKLDIAITNLTVAGQISIFLGVGNGTFGAAVNFTAGGQPRELTIGYFNNDAHLDLVVANAGPGTISVLMGTGTGLFALATNYPTGAFPSSVVVGDFNNDTYPDIATCNVTPDNVSVFINDGTGLFIPGVSYNVATDPYGINVGDFNSDNILDLVTANNGSDDASILIGTGSGTFGAATTISVGVGSVPRYVAVADFNSDGKDDIVFPNPGTGLATVLLGNGAGGFGALNNFSVGSAANYLSVSDFNGDNKTDIVVCNQGNANVSVLINNAPTVTYSTATYDTLCLTNASIALTGASPIGGTFSGTGVVGLNFDPSVSNLGDFIVTYVYNDANGCQSVAMDTIHVDVCLEMNVEAVQSGMSIYPNPSQGNITIDIGFAKKESACIRIFNSLGEEVKNEKQEMQIGDNKLELNLTALPVGLYFIRFETSSQTLTKRVYLN